MHVTLDDIQAAAARLEPYLHRTPLLRSATLSRMAGCDLRLKAEHLQRGGSFKARGALNKLLTLDDTQRKHGVVAFSSGNHAQGVALIAIILGVDRILDMCRTVLNVAGDLTAATYVARSEGYELLRPHKPALAVAGIVAAGPASSDVAK